MPRLILGIAMLSLAATAAGAEGVNGVWKTEADDDGGYLHVTVAPCESDAAKTCGKITEAFTKDGPDRAYPNLGKWIVKDMASEDGESFSDGTIWDPVHDRTFDSKMVLKGDDLDVSGCVSIICIGQDWKRVK